METGNCHHPWENDESSKSFRLHFDFCPCLSVNPVHQPPIEGNNHEISAPEASCVHFFGTRPSLGSHSWKLTGHGNLGITSTSYMLYIIYMRHPRIENAVWILQQIHCHHHCAFNCHYQIVQTGAYNGDDVPQQVSECSCSPNLLDTSWRIHPELIMTHVMLIHVMLHLNLKPFESPVSPNVLYKLTGISPNKSNRLRASTGAAALGRGKCLMELWSLVPQNPKISTIL